MSKRQAPQGGFGLIELLIVIVIIGILAAIAIPLYVGQRNDAKEAALRMNARHIAIVTTGFVADGLITAWQTSHALTNGTLSAEAAKYVNCALEETLKGGRTNGANTDGYTNPYSGKESILVQTSTSAPSGQNVRPALWITQQSGGSNSYTWGRFTTSATTKSALAGSVVACWNTSTSKIEIFWVDKDGKKSASYTTISM